MPFLHRMPLPLGLRLNESSRSLAARLSQFLDRRTYLTRTPRSLARMRARDTVRSVRLKVAIRIWEPLGAFLILFSRALVAAGAPPGQLKKAREVCDAASAGAASATDARITVSVGMSR